MGTRWIELTDTYMCDTDQLSGGIKPFGHYHGVCGLVHRHRPFNLVKPAGAFLNAEYYIRPGSAAKMVPRALSRQQLTTHEQIDDDVVVRFPPEPEYGLSLALTYSVRDEAIDMRMTIDPTADVPGFQIFFASYVCEALDETWVPLRNPDGTRDWSKIHHLGNLGDTFGVLRDSAARKRLLDKYPDLDSSIEVQTRPFDRPILVARDSTDGLALVIMCQPDITPYVMGQYHVWDTAHDWAFAVDLRAGERVGARARMVCCPLPDVAGMSGMIDDRWGTFVEDIGCQESSTPTDSHGFGRDIGHSREEGRVKEQRLHEKGHWHES